MYNLSTKRSAHSGNSSSSSPLFLSLQKKQVWAEFFKMQVGSKSVDDIDSSMMKRLQQRYKLKSAMSTGSRRLGRICNLFSSSTDDGSLRQFRVKKVWLVSFRTCLFLEFEVITNYYYFEWKQTKCFCPTRYVCSLAGIDAAINWAVLRFIDKVFTSSMLFLVLIFVVFFYLWIIAFAVSKTILFYVGS